jgi:glycerol-3-phosphate dehydrogenase (NAD(P)+)
MKVTVIGAGAWGTALANLLCQNKNEVTLWAYEAEQVRQMREEHCNRLFLPGISLSPEMRFENDLEKSLEGSPCAVIAVPSKFFRSVTSRIAGFEGIAISVAKGIEYDSGLTMSGVLKTTLPKATIAVLSGPTLALEVARNIPAAIVAAHPDMAVAGQVQQLFHQRTLRVYTCADVLGVELGGALKNILAIAAGVADGLGFGDNAKAAMITRAIVEIRRLGAACGARPETFSGLSGLGDLTVTCFSKLSRNRAFGERVGRGEKVDAILAGMITVAEGYPTARSAYKLARDKKVETPIIDEVYAMLYQAKDVWQAVNDLMTRSMKQED